MKSDNRFMTVREAARELRVSAMTVYRAISQDEFPVLKIGGRYVVLASVIDEMASAAEKHGGVVYAADWADKPAA